MRRLPFNHLLPNNRAAIERTQLRNVVDNGILANYVGLGDITFFATRSRFVGNRNLVGGRLIQLFAVLGYKYILKRFLIGNHSIVIWVEIAFLDP